jgi:hypothetical protein
MNIYFAASIRGGREHADLYRPVIEHLQSFGTVLSEHVGDRSLSAEQGEDLDSRFIHDRDMGWLEAADILVAEVSAPSLGVGYEVASAVQAGKPILCLYRPQTGTRLSAMIEGCPQAVVVTYTSLEEAMRAIDGFMKEYR